MKKLARKINFSLPLLLYSAQLLLAQVSLAQVSEEKINELRTRSSQILDSLHGLDAKLEGLRIVPLSNAPFSEIDSEEDWTIDSSNSLKTPLPEDIKNEYSSQESDEAGRGQSTPRESKFETMSNEEFDFVIEPHENEKSFKVENGDVDSPSSSPKFRHSRGDYYLILSTGFQFGSDLDVHHDGLLIQGEIDTQPGYSMSMEFGRSLGMLEIGLLAGFSLQELGSFSGAASGYTGHLSAGEGEISNYYLAIRPNVFFELSDLIGIRAGTSLGISSRHNNYSLKLPFNELHEAGVGLLWDFHSSLQLALWDSGGLSLGYRFAYIGDTGDFGALGAHAIEASARWGF